MEVQNDRNLAKENYFQTQLLQDDSLARRARTIQRNIFNYKRFLVGKEYGQVLDIGPGRGEMIETYMLLGFDEITCIDVSPEIISYVEKKFSVNGILMSECVKHFDGMNRVYGVVTMLHVLEHLDTDEAISMLSAVRSSLTDDGVLIVEVPNSANIFTNGAIWASDITHLQQYTSKSLKQILRLAGFSKIDLYGLKIQGYSPLRMLQKLVVYFLNNLQKTFLKIYLPSESLLTEPIIFAVARRSGIRDQERCMESSI